MKTSNIFIIIIILCMFIKCDNTNNVDDPKYINLELINANLLGIIDNFLLNELDTLDLDVSITDLNRNSFKIKDILDTKYKVFFYFTEVGCSPCLDQQIEILKEFNQKFPLVEITILASYNLLRHLVILAQQKGINYPVYNLAFKDIGVNFEKYSQPFYFIANDEGIIKLFFSPVKEQPDITRNYLYYLVTRKFI